MLLVAGISGMALLDYSPLIGLHDVRVSGAVGVSAGAVAARAYDGYSGLLFGRMMRIPTLLNFSSAKARGAIMRAFPEIEDVRIARSWPHYIDVHVTERKPVGTWCRVTEQSRPCYYFDAYGAIWGRAAPSSGTLLLNVRDERPEGDIQSGLLDSILVIVSGLRELDLRVRQVLIGHGPLEEVRLSVTDGFDIIFSLEHELSAQMEVLGVFLADRRAAGPFSAGYVDLRVPEKVFYR